MTRAVARAISDTRRKASCDHSLIDLLQQRIYGLVLGYEDLNDQGELRHDLALQTAASRMETSFNALYARSLHIAGLPDLRSYWVILLDGSY